MTNYRNLVFTPYRARTRWIHDEVDPRFVPPAYRFLTSPVHASDLVNKGEIRLSTLHHSRNEAFENSDPAEAKQTLIVPYLGPETPTDQRDRILARLAAFGMDAKDKELIDERVQREDRDGYVVFLSTDKDAALRDHCVEISQPMAFFHLLREALLLKMGLTEYQFGRVNYSARFLIGAGGAMVRPALAGSPDFEDEREIRMLWWARQEEMIKPMVLTIPELAKYCRLMF